MPPRRITVRELAELLPSPTRPLTREELERLMPSDVASRPLRPDGWGPWAGQETDRVPPWPDTTPNKKDRPP